MAVQIYVDSQAKINGNGSRERPFQKIGEAARVALPGDEVLVLPGIYREEVSPVTAGTREAPVVFRSVEPRAAVITGAEPARGWVNVAENVWKLTIPNRLFGAYNPYTTLVWGDWLNQQLPVHTGEVYLGEKSLYETDSYEKVLHPVPYPASWDVDFTCHTWYTCQDEERDETILYANFQGKDPNREQVEINVRPHCFFPVQEHVDYITLSGFTVTRAATQWAPPTALQEGMIGPHWSKGWVIENCEISHSKCSGISLGKYLQQGNDNRWSRRKVKDGAQTQRECSMVALLEGWSKETIGSHIVRNCEIHDCGQTGIVGNLGCVFSLIENNHIHHINNKRNLAGAEIGGIKLHAAIDVILRGNHIHDCTRGIWLDWQAQGTRVSSNLFHDNCLSRDHLLKKENKAGLGMGEDLWIEVAHGPTLVDNNVFLSERNIRLAAQGVAFVHNLFYGSISGVGRGVKNGTVQYDSTRYTPVHRPHSTQIVNMMSILHGDDRFYNNVFVQPPVRQGMWEICEEDHNDEWDNGNLIAGTQCFDGFLSDEQWAKHFEGYCGEGSPDTRDKYYMPLPVWFGGNAYFNGAIPCSLEKDPFVDREHTVTVSLHEQEGQLRLVSDLFQYLPQKQQITTDTLGRAFEPEEAFETPEGEKIVFDRDLYGRQRSVTPIPGPVEEVEKA